LDQKPVDRLLLNMMGKDYLARMEVLSQEIIRLVKERYASERGDGELWFI